ncbi:TPA: drug/metabolite exporter YedA [Citrobacter freundii]
MRSRQLLPLFGALFALYIIWGSTYFVIRIGVESWPPLMMAGLRFLSAGVLLMIFLLLRGDKLPSLRPLLNAALIGVLLLSVGNGMVTVAEHQNVPSGIAAVVVATVPLFTLCFSYFFGIKTRKLEWAGIAIGLAGIILLNSGGNLSGNPWGAVIILIGSLSWAFGSVFGSRVTLPTGMMAGAIELLAAGVVLLCASFLSGEKLTALPPLSGFMALGYLAIFGSVIAINAYMYLIRNVTPALATSYAYVNPVVAVLLGTGLGGEHLSSVEWLALGVIVFSVVLVTLGKYLFPAAPASAASAPELHTSK